jgi:hypothetical protein
MPPGGDSAFLIFGSFDQAKERTRIKQLNEMLRQAQHDKTQTKHQLTKIYLIKEA